MLSQNIAKGIQQLLSNASKLMDAYVRTKDESLVPIIKGLLEAASVELEDAATCAEAQLLHPFDIIPPRLSPDPRPQIEPTIVMYGAYMDPQTTCGSDAKFTYTSKPYKED